DRDTGLKAGMLGARGFSATTMAITFESYQAVEPHSPMTGLDWRPGEMQYVFKTQPGQTSVLECMTTSMHERGGGFGLCSQPFQIKEGQVVWSEAMVHLPSDGEADGAMFSYLQQAMSVSTVIEEMAADKRQLAKLLLDAVDDPEVRLFHADMATCQVLLKDEVATSVALLADPGTEREQWIAERMDDSDQAT